MNFLGHLVRAKRIEKGLSQEQLAILAGLGRTRSLVDKIERSERGVKRPEPDTLEKLARALEIDPQLLWLASSLDGAAEKLTGSGIQSRQAIAEVIRGLDLPVESNPDITRRELLRAAAGLAAVETLPRLAGPASPGVLFSLQRVEGKGHTSSPRQQLVMPTFGARLAAPLTQIASEQWLITGWKFKSERKFDEARSAFQNAAHGYPKGAQRARALIEIAQLARDQGDLTHANQQLEQLTAEHELDSATSIAVDSLKAWIHADRGETSRAEELFRSLIPQAKQVEDQSLESRSYHFLGRLGIDRVWSYSSLRRARAGERERLEASLELLKKTRHLGGGSDINLAFNDLWSAMGEILVGRHHSVWRATMSKAFHEFGENAARAHAVLVGATMEAALADDQESFELARDLYKSTLPFFAQQEIYPEGVSRVALGLACVESKLSAANPTPRAADLSLVSLIAHPYSEHWRWREAWQSFQQEISRFDQIAYLEYCANLEERIKTGADDFTWLRDLMPTPERATMIEVVVRNLKNRRP